VPGVDELAHRRTGKRALHFGQEAVEPLTRP
jgi:hypothetical protein